MSNPKNAPIAPASDVADLREQIANLAGVVGTLANAALAPRARTTSRKVVAAEMSPVQKLCSDAGFRSGSARNALFTALFDRGPGDYALSDFAGASTSDAQVIARRLARKAVPFSLIVDGEERGNAVLIFRAIEKAE
jgi:hypothetical protein